MLKTVGYILLLISCLLFLMIPVVPWIGFSKIQIAGITTGLIIAGEILFYLSLAILGKSFWGKIKGKLQFWKARTPKPGLEEPAGTDQIITTQLVVENPEEAVSKRNTML